MVESDKVMNLYSCVRISYISTSDDKPTNTCGFHPFRSLLYLAEIGGITQSK
jgi:hypothetical protein